MIIKGQKINDRYQIIRMIGEGGMANVYLAEDTILDRKVAVKILRGDLADDEKFVRRFQREAISASSLNHPNIVEMYDVGEDDGKYFIVMEYVEGKTLKNLIKKRGALTVHEVVDIMLQLTSAISHAHDSYIIHRDIKPQNVLILDDGCVKITDFGIAMALNSNELTQTNSVMGSVHYLPPEQANGHGSTIKSDIYSLGILLYELLTGKIPFKGENAVEIAIKHMKESIPSVCKINPDIPQSLENIILMSTAKNPKNRYDSVNEMHEDLERALKETAQNDKRVVYRYPEQDLEETKKMPTIETPIIKKEEINIGKEDKKLNKILIILGSIAGVLLIGIAMMVLIIPALFEVPNVKVPDVKNLTVVDAETKLREAGLEVKTEVIEQSDNEIEEGKVIKTNPQVGRTVKKKTEVTLVVSIGSQAIVIDDYKNKNFYEIKGLLEAQDLHVLFEKKDVDSIDPTLKEYTIIDQKPAAGTKLVKGDTVTLIIPNIVTEYPDFTDGSWNLDDVYAFADNYSLIISVEYKETNDYKPGSIIKQSREPKSTVMIGASLKVTVAIKPVEEDPLDDIIGS